MAELHFAFPMGTPEEGDFASKAEYIEYENGTSLKSKVDDIASQISQKSDYFLVTLSGVTKVDGQYRGIPSKTSAEILSLLESGASGWLHFQYAAVDFTMPLFVNNGRVFMSCAVNCAESAIRIYQGDITSSNICRICYLESYTTGYSYKKTEVDTELAKKVDKVDGKGLSTNDYTNIDKNNVALLLASLGDASELETEADNAVDAINEVNSKVGDIGSEFNRVDDDINEVANGDYGQPDYEALPLLCGQPPILFGAGTPQEAVVPTNWKQFADGGYNWNGLPSAIGQVYINTSATSNGRYTAYQKADGTLAWLNF